MKFANKILVLFLALLATSCVDPYQLETTNFEEALVIEATLTNQLKYQQVKITKTYKLEQSQPIIVTDADVEVSDDSGNSYAFSASNGIYISDEAFQAEPGRKYKLRINSGGKIYESSTEMLSVSQPIESITTSVESVNGQRGVQIKVNSFDPTGNSKYYRFSYDETYKVVVPFWSEYVASVQSDGVSGFSVTDTIKLTPRTYEARTCYSTQKSTALIVTKTVGLSEDRILDFPIRFIKANDPIIKNRYSINVTQYVQSLAAYTFYETLSELSAAGENIFSQNQPGFFYGNITSISNPSEKVIGFFEVSGVSEKRIFFDFEDVFPNDSPPPYLYDCEIYEYDSTAFGPGNNQGSTLRSFITSGKVLYFDHAMPIYYVVKPQCGDCTSFSSNVIPSFWE